MSTFSLKNHRDFEAQDWSEKRQSEKGDSFTDKTLQVCPERRKLGLIQNDISRLKSIWFRKFTKEQRFIFRQRFGYIAELLSIEVDSALLTAVLEFWDPSYRCFSFKAVDLAPTYEEYSQMLGMQPDFPIKLYMGMRGDVKRAEIMLYKITNIGREVSQSHFLTQRNRKVLNIDFIWPHVEDHLSEESGMKSFALLIYGLVLFPTIRNSIDLHVIHLFERVVEGKINPVPTILAETYRSLSLCRRNSDWKFHACAPLLNLWLKSHFESTIIPRPKGLYRDYSQASSTRADSEPRSVRQWVMYLHELERKDLRWISEFGTVRNVLWRCKDMGYLPLLGVWGEIGYTPLMVLRQFGVTQFVPATDYLKDEGFEYTDPSSADRIRAIADAWKRLDYIAIDGEESAEITSQYEIWTSKRVRDVAALNEWAADSVNCQPPGKEEMMVEQYRKLLNRKIEDFNSLMSKMQTDLESQQWITETQDERIERAEKGKRKAIQEKESVRESNAHLNDTIRKLLRFMEMRMIKIADMEGMIDKVKAQCAEELNQERQRSAHQRRMHEREKQGWEAEKRELVEVVRDQDTQDKDLQILEMKEQLQQKDLQIRELQRVSRDEDEWRIRYEELRDQVDQQLAAAAYEIQERKEHVDRLKEDLENLRVAQEKSERELVQRRVENWRIRQGYADQAEQWTSQWESVRMDYEDKIRDMTTQVNTAIKAASRIYDMIHGYREDTLRGYRDLPALPDFLNEILLLSSRIEKVVANF